MLADLVCLGIALLPQISLLFWSPATARVAVGGRR
ncbi:hypothetical protein ABID82_002263 [Methylobacterium sp. PvP062]|uniref:Uncharacterized protein n=1 Tax=Methylobacterium radiotolerans TaxID=31998 RepID=A0ABV2NN98_9HYPH|nr:hypothetical protein [Methylobacterium sp. PvP105]MBP2504724.1 hypothetical protein [Methylobacterium sp. PvP109]